MLPGHKFKNGKILMFLKGYLNIHMKKLIKLLGFNFIVRSTCFPFNGLQKEISFEDLKGIAI